MKDSLHPQQCHSGRLPWQLPPGREDKSTNKYKVPCKKDYGKWGWVVECLHA